MSGSASDPLPAMTQESLTAYLEAAGAKVASRAGRSEHYGSPREFSFEVKALFPNGLCLHLLARQYSYRDPWETSGRVNDQIDVLLLRDGQYSELPKGLPFFQGTDTEEAVDFPQLEDIVARVRSLNPKLFTLQELTGDL
jgi:hypothetical protein